MALDQPSPKLSSCISNHPESPNFLAITGFRFIIHKARKVSFYCNSANLPGINLGSAIQATYLKNIDVPGDKITYQDLVIRFLVDENMENYLQIYDWMTGLGYPEEVKQYQDLKGNSKYFPSRSSRDPFNERSDATLQILTSNYNVNTEVIFKDVFPSALTPLTFDATVQDQQYLTAEATFKYTIYDIYNSDGEKV